MSEFLNMGEHANFIWLSYGVTFLVIVILGVLSWRRHVRFKKLIDSLKVKRKEDQK
jgi:heme exporter protein CcmD